MVCRGGQSHPNQFRPFHAFTSICNKVQAAQVQALLALQYSNMAGGQGCHLQQEYYRKNIFKRVRSLILQSAMHTLRISQNAGAIQNEATQTPTVTTEACVLCTQLASVFLSEAPKELNGNPPSPLLLRYMTSRRMLVFFSTRLGGLASFLD